MKTARVFRLLAFTLSVSAGVGTYRPALGNDHLARQTVYASPVATAWAVPTAYVYPTSLYYPTSSVWATSYMLPTVYSPSYTVAPTSYVVPSYYSPTSYTVAPTSYVVPTYYSATSYAVAARSYYTPTTLSYYWPSAWYEPSVAYLPAAVDYQVAGVSSPCESAPTRVVRATPSAPAPAPTKREPAPASVDSEPAPPAPAAGAPISSRVDSNVGDEPKQKVEPAPAEPKKNPGRLDSLEGKPEEKKEQLTPLSPPPGDNKADSPPSPPAADREPAKKVSEAPPAVPASPAPEESKPVDVPLNLPPLEESTLRKARKPVFGSPTKLSENVLSGIVKSGDTNELVEGVPVRLTNRLHAYSDRALETDAYGRFAVRLPDGDWDVQVTMPSGRVYTVSRLTVSSGKIVDDQGRKIPSLIITR